MICHIYEMEQFYVQFSVFFQRNNVCLWSMNEMLQYLLIVLCICLNNWTAPNLFLAHVFEIYCYVCL